MPQYVRDGAAEQSIFLLVGAGGGLDDRPALRLLPDTPPAQAAFTAMDRDMYFWRLNATTGEAVFVCCGLCCDWHASWLMTAAHKAV